MHFWMPLPFDRLVLAPRDAGSVFAVNDRVRTPVDVERGVLGTPERGPADARRDVAEVAPLRSGRLVAEETTRGPVTRLFDARGRVRLEMLGEPRALVELGALVVGLVTGRPTSTADRVELFASALDGEDPPLRLDLPAPAGLAVAGDRVVAVCSGRAIVVAARDGRVCAAGVGLPENAAAGVIAAGHRAAIAAGTRLLVLDVDAIAVAPGVSAQAVRFEPLSLDTGPDELAQVVFAGPSMVVVEHPRCKRLTIKRKPGDPEAQKGDQVRVEGLTETLPGVFRATGYRPASDRSRAAPSAPPLDFAAPDIRAADSTAVPPSARVSPMPNAERLAALAARLAFSVPPLLAAMVALWDRDRIARRWMERLSLLVEVRDLMAGWSQDPSLLAVVGSGNGDEVGFYLYPPALRRDASPPLAELCHETNEIEYRGASFEAWLAGQLHGHAERERRTVELLLDRLELPRAFPARFEPGPAPSWWPKPVSPAETMQLVARARAALDAGDALTAERSLAMAFSASHGNEVVATALRQAYRALGWSYHLEVLGERP